MNLDICVYNKRIKYKVVSFLIIICALINIPDRCFFKIQKISGNTIKRQISIAHITITLDIWAFTGFDLESARIELIKNIYAISLFSKHKN